MTSCSLSFLYVAHSVLGPCPRSASLYLSPFVFCPPHSPFHPPEDGEDEGPFEVVVRPKIIRHTWRPNWWCCPPPGATNTHTHTCRHRKSPTHFLRHSLTETHTFPSSHQSVVTIGLGKTKYRLPPTLLTDWLPLCWHTTENTHTHTNET